MIPSACLPACQPESQRQRNSAAAHAGDALLWRGCNVACSLMKGCYATGVFLQEGGMQSGS